MVTHHRSEDGQAIVLIVLTLAVLLAFLALAVDGGNMYVHRRLAQNASDAGAMAGAMNLLIQGATDAGVRSQVLDRVAANGVDPAAAGSTVQAWYIDTAGNRISDIEVGAWGYVPTDQGAAGVEVRVDTEFDTFVAQIVGRTSLRAATDSGAVVTFPTFCADWVLYADCPDCGNITLHHSGADKTIRGGGIKSNDGLHVTGANMTLDPPVAEYAGDCVGSLCPESGGPAQRVPAAPMPVLYRYEDFVPGGYWWNDMCQGSYADKCHTEWPSGSNPIDSGLWVIDGGLDQHHSFVPGKTHFTFVLNGDVHLTANEPMMEPFIGSSTTGGAKLLFFLRQGNLRMNGNSHDWDGVIYVPHGEAVVTGSSDRANDGSVFAWTIHLTGASSVIQHSTYFCPPEQSKIVLLW